VNRREFVSVAAWGLLAAPLAAEAQQARVYPVGVVLEGGPYFAAIDGLRDGLKELGLEEGKQFVLHVRDTKGDLKAVEAAARGLEAEKVDLIYAVTTSVTLATKRATEHDCSPCETVGRPRPREARHHAGAATDCCRAAQRSSDP